METDNENHRGEHRTKSKEITKQEDVRDELDKEKSLEIEVPSPGPCIGGLMEKTIVEERKALNLITQSKQDYYCTSSTHQPYQNHSVVRGEKTDQWSGSGIWEKADKRRWERNRGQHAIPYARDSKGSTDMFVATGLGIKEYLVNFENEEATDNKTKSANNEEVIDRNIDEPEVDMVNFGAGGSGLQPSVSRSVFCTSNNEQTSNFCTVGKTQQPVRVFGKRTGSDYPRNDGSDYPRNDGSDYPRNDGSDYPRNQKKRRNRGKNMWFIVNTFEDFDSKEKDIGRVDGNEKDSNKKKVQETKQIFEEDNSYIEEHNIQTANEPMGKTRKKRKRKRKRGKCEKGGNFNQQQIEENRANANVVDEGKSQEEHDNENKIKAENKEKVGEPSKKRRKTRRGGVRARMRTMRRRAREQATVSSPSISLVSSVSSSPGRGSPSPESLRKICVNRNRKGPEPALVTPLQSSGYLNNSPDYIASSPRSSTYCKVWSPSQFSGLDDLYSTTGAGFSLNSPSGLSCSTSTGFSINSPIGPRLAIGDDLSPNASTGDIPSPNTNASSVKEDLPSPKSPLNTSRSPSYIATSP